MIHLFVCVEDVKIQTATNFSAITLAFCVIVLTVRNGRHLEKRITGQDKKRQGVIIMFGWKEKRLGRCNAWVYTTAEDDVETVSISYTDSSGFVNEKTYSTESVDIYILQSYSSVVCILIYDGERYTLYKLPRSTYSITTQKQVSKFVDEYVHSLIGYRRFNAFAFSLGLGCARSW